MEIWKPIPGYEGLYEASNLGNIKSLERNVYNGVSIHILRMRILKPIPNGNGYYSVYLRKDNASHRVYIHRLIAKTFISNDDPSLQVNHIDGNRANNQLSNLEWVTQSENHFHRYRVLGQSGVNKGKTGALNWKSKPLSMIDTNGKVVRLFPGIMEAGRKLGVPEWKLRNAANMSKVFLGHTWSYNKISRK